MRELLLHIGRHKTGTTAIQNFLQDNRAALADFGFLVPQSGRVKDGHHDLARPLQPRHADQRKGVPDPRLLPAFVDLKEELTHLNPGDTAIISSEGFQNCKPALVSEAFADYDARVVVYLRNQLDYLASAYVQRVHATHYTGTLRDFYTDVYLRGNNYASFIEGWSKQFPGRVCVRRYGEGNIIKDFIEHALQISAGTLVIRQTLSNPSLNSVITQFKLELNRRQPKDAPPQLLIYPLLTQLNEQFPGPKFTLPQVTARDLIENCRESDNAVAVRYFGESQLFDYTGYACGDAVRMDDALFNGIYAALIRLVAAEAET